MTSKGLIEEDPVIDDDLEAQKGKINLENGTASKDGLIAS